MKNIVVITVLFYSFMLPGMFLSGQKYTSLSDFPEDIKSSKPFERIKWKHQQRAYPYDTIPYYYANRIKQKEIKKIRQRSDKRVCEINWVPKGPSVADASGVWPSWDKVSGRVKALAVHPGDHQTVYIGSASGGLWKTMNGGEEWMDIGHDLESTAFGAIAIDPNNPETIYAGSGEAIAEIDWLAWGGYGMYKSTDGGSSWDTINAFGEFTIFTDIVVSPYDSEILFAALSNGPINMGGNLPNEGIWKSADAGMTWEKKLDFQDAYDIAIHPTDSLIVYACIGGLHANSGIYVSFDQGETWETSNFGLPAPEIINRLQMDISQSDPDTLYTAIYLTADTIPYGQNTVVYKSTDGGDIWFQIANNDILGGYISGTWYDQGWYDLCIAIDPQNGDHVFIGNVELHETTDGQNFSPVRYSGTSNLLGSIAHCDYHQLKYAPSNPEYFYIGCDGGVYLSTDDCNSAESRNEGLETIQFYRMGSHPTNSDIMIAGSQDNGTLMTNDGGETWDVVMDGDGMECFFDNQNPMIVYASYQRGYLMRSLSGGSSFSFFGSMNGAWVTPFFTHSQSSDTLYSANYDILRKSWNSSWQEQTTNLSPVLINTLAQSKVDPNHMILAGNISETTPYPAPPEFPVMISTDGGYNWTEVTENIPGDVRWISRVICDPADENTMYVVRCGFCDGNKVYRTTDLGETWDNISGDLPDIPCNTLFIDPENTQYIYVGTDLGVYLSEDGGISYEYAGGEMPYVPIMDFEYVKFDNIRYLRVATHGRGIYETTDLHVEISEKRIQNRTVISARPNPFSSLVTLSYQLQQSSTVQIDLYNQFGTKMMERMNKRQNQGNHEMKIDLRDLKSGVYFCILKTNEGIYTQKLIKTD